MYQRYCNTLLFLQPKGLGALLLFYSPLLSNSRVTPEWPNLAAVLKNCADVLQGRDQAFILCACMNCWGLGQVCSSCSLSPCVTFISVVLMGQNQFWLLQSYALCNSPGGLCPYKC